MKIPFNQPHATSAELKYIQQAIHNGCLSGNGEFSKRCQARLEAEIVCNKALLTHSCTAALEMAAILSDIQPGDEVIMPSYTFVSTANAFVLRGGVPVFVDIRPDTLNIDEMKIEAAITPKTKAIVPVHYAGVGCEMNIILDIARRNKLLVIEDAAQGFLSTYRQRGLGSMGHLAALSFHETKNVISGEGGALLINDPSFIQRAEIIWEKGTNRSQFFRGLVDKYSWVDVGSSYLPSEIIAAFLWAQLEDAESITLSRLEIWRQYHDAFEDLENRGLLRRPVVPPECEHNAHMYYILLANLDMRTALIDFLKVLGINSVFHYVPLHSSPAGQRFARSSGELQHTDELSNRILRLPLFPGLTPDRAEKVIDAVHKFLTS
ncbi:MAG: dTDP-4-amino-4,6-dideoxygalactose transaminase [Synechococcus sp.]